MNYLVEIPKIYIKKRKNIFDLKLVSTLKYCNRYIEIYEFKQNHFYYSLNKLFFKNDKIVKPIVISNKNEIGLKGLKNRLLFKWFCYKYNIYTLPF